MKAAAPANARRVSKAFPVLSTHDLLVKILYAFYGSEIASRICLMIFGCTVTLRVERNDDPSAGLLIDAMTTFERNQTKPAFKSIVSASGPVRRGSLGMNFESGGKYFLAQCLGSFFIGQSFQEEFDRLTDVRKSFFDCFPLRLTTLQFWTPGVVSPFILFDHHADLPRHSHSF
jgi:hypothetical protein